MKKMKKALALMMAAVFAVSAAGCSTPTTTVGDAGTEAPAADSGDSGEASADSGDSSGVKRFVYSVKSDIATLDGQMSNSVADSTVGYHLSAPLYRNVQGTAQPEVATDYTVSDDGLVYTFTLRQDAKWSDGEPLTAHDYEYGMKRLMDPATASPFAFIGEHFKNGYEVETGAVPVDELGVKALDDYTLEITLSHPAGYFIGMVGMTSFAPARQDIVEKYGTEYCSTADKQVYSGPFMATEFGNGKVVMKKNPNYFDADKIKLDEVEVITVSNADTALSMFENGELDYVEIPNAMVPQYEGQSLSHMSGANDYVALNHANKYLANKNFRLALNDAIHREEYNLLANDGVYQPNQRYVLPIVAGAEKTFGEEYPYEAFPLQSDMDKANEYMAAAMSELGISDPSEISLKLLTPDDDTSKVISEVIANQFNTALGINVEIEMVPYKTKNTRMNAKEYEMIYTGWAPDYSDPNTYLELWESTSSYNYLNYNSPEYDAQMALSRETTGKERMDALFAAEQILLEDGALVPLQLRLVHYLVSDRVQGFETYFVGYDLNYLYADIVE